MKSGVRIAAVSSGPIQHGKKALLVCVVAREGIVEGVLSGSVAIDGSDSTTRITSMIKGSRFRDQVKLLALNGIAIAGLNVVDITQLGKALGIKFTIMTRRRPRKTLLIRALRKRGGLATAVSRKIGIIESVSKENILRTNGLYFQGNAELAGSLPGYVFEALRVSHLIASGMAKGESTGRI
jgi:hypothetical protein